MADQHTTEALDNRYIARVSIGQSFSTNEESIKYMLASNDLAKDPDNAGNDIAPTVADIQNIIDSLPKYSLKAKHRDTYLGGNDAVNSYYQFNENDDIIHPMNETNGGGMGRIYNETFDENQQLLYFSFGVPDFANAEKFIADAYDTNLAKLMNTGDVSVVEKIGTFLGKTIGTIIKIPILPLTLTLDLVQAITNSVNPPTKYYDFQPTMALYYKTVNVIMATIAANMNLADMVDDPAVEGGITNGIPEILRTHGLDILSILSRKQHYDDGEAGNAPTTDEMIQHPKNAETNMSWEKSAWANAADGVGEALTEAMRYFAFRLEKSAGSSESGSNTTKEPDFLEMVNSQVRAGRERTFNMESLKNTGLGKVIGGIYGAVESVVGGVADSLNISGGLEMLKGSGFLDVPELWASSSFHKSYSFDFQLRTPYGDPISIFYSLYVPLAMLIAGAFPRSVGQNTYTSPFIVRAYSQGMFAIPLGLIDSITIRRGNAEYGWSNASGSMLPTEIDVSISVKDLSPLMHIALTDGEVKDWMKILGQNSTFQEYMLTLSGVNVAQRTLLKKQIANRTRALLTIASNNRFNALMFGFSLGNTKLGRAMTFLNPYSRVPGAVPKASG